MYSISALFGSQLATAAAGRIELVVSGTVIATQTVSAAGETFGTTGTATYNPATFTGTKPTGAVEVRIVATGIQATQLAVDNVKLATTAPVPFGGNDTVDGGAGNDSITAGMGDDSVIGGIGNDTIQGGAGNDRVDGGAGLDSIDGGLGNDSITGGAGADNILGGDGLDTISGGTENDSIDGGAGNDSLLGDDGNDTILGGADNDNIDGGLGNDSILGGAGTDTILGGDGLDMISGGTENDSINGGAGSDSILDGDGTDTLLGGEGNDTLNGGLGNDSLTGGVGDDQFIVGEGNDVITDFTTGESGSADDNTQTNNDFVDLSGFYSQANYDAAVASGTINPAVIKDPLQWMRADQDNDGILNDTLAGWSATRTLTIQNGGVAVAGSDLNFDRANVLCYAHGTLITTAEGDAQIETLKEGDLVKTLDNDYKQILWIGSRKLSAAELDASPNLRPIRIRAGALGNSIPNRDLIVSPQHRILIDSLIAERIFGQRQVLAAAKCLLALDGVEIVEDGEGVEYIHFLCDQHEIVFAEGAASETLYTGKEALKSLTPEGKCEIFTIFPELIDMDADTLPRAARILAGGKQSRKMVERHISNRVVFAMAC